MNSTLAGLVAALIALKINNKMLSIKREDAYITYAAPIVEETAKTFSALLLKASVFGTHVVFGLVEALYDYTTSRKGIGVAAGLISVVSHALFGFITVFVMTESGSVFIGLVSGVVLHGLWNTTVIKLLENKSS